MNDFVTRYVITYIPDRNAVGRTLVEPRQGRYTYETREKAAEAMASLMGPTGFTRIMSTAELRTVEVRPCPCYPGHFDPQTCWFD